MLYSIFIYGSEARVAHWTPEEEEETLGRHAAFRKEWLAQARLGPVMRLAPEIATTVRVGARGEPLLTDGPFAESKEQLMGLYTLECASLDEAIATVKRLNFDSGVFEIRPVTWLDPGVLPAQMPPDET